MLRFGIWHLLFEEYLQLIAESDDVEAGIFRMDIREFDDQFALIEKMKNDITRSCGYLPASIWKSKSYFISCRTI